MIAPDGRAQAQSLEEEKVLRALVHHGALSFHRISRKVLPEMDLRRCDNVLRRLVTADQIATSARGPQVWSITDVGRTRLHLPRFGARVGARVGAISATSDERHTTPAIHTP